MLEENALSITVLLVYIIFFAIAWLIAMIPAVINAIGLARICNKLGAFKPVWCWVWALLCSPIALLRAGDLAAERQDPYARKHFGGGVLSVVVFAVLIAIASGFGMLTAFSANDEQVSTFTTLFTIFMLLLILAAVVIAIWMTVLLYISYFRIFKLYVPTWGAWLMIAGMILLSQFAFLLLPVLSFLPMKDPEQ